MPGAYVPPNQVGVNQTVYIRGGYYDQIGYEYDGVPINRSFDNYPGNSETTLGQQELQIYTGGGEADANATGLAGFINQVIKTGTFPGYAIGGLAIGTPTFYHDARVEAGGSTPDRMFSYYVGLSGTNQDFRYFDQYNGASLTDTIPYGYWPAHITTFLPFYPAVYPTCSNNFTYTNPAVKKYNISDPGCFGSYPSYFGQPSNISSRDVVANFHVGIPHRRDAGRDDVQLLYMSSANFQQDYSSLDDAGALGLGIVNDGLNPTPYQCSPPDFYCGSTNQWPDYYTYSGNTRWLAPASTTPIAYMYPGSPRALRQRLPARLDQRPEHMSGQRQRQSDPGPDSEQLPRRPLGYRQHRQAAVSKEFRLVGICACSSDTLLLEHESRHGQRLGNNTSLGVTNYQYMVDAHTGGLELQFADQLSGQHLLSGMVSYITSNTLRYSNHNYFNTSSQQVSNFTDGSQCFATYATRRYKVGVPAPCNALVSQGTFGAPYGSFTAEDPCADGELSASAPACEAGASMLLTYLGNSADLNAVVPKLTNARSATSGARAIAWNINASVRFENDTYGLANTEQSGDELLVRGRAARVLRQSGHAPADLRPAAAAEHLPIYADRDV